MATQSEVKPVQDGDGNTRIIAIVDDDESVRFALEGMMKSVGLPAQARRLACQRICQKSPPRPVNANADQ